MALKSKLVPPPPPVEVEAQKQGKKKQKDPLEGIFSSNKSKRLPVFADITFSSKD
jgi:hypothetical protein